MAIEGANVIAIVNVWGTSYAPTRIDDVTFEIAGSDETLNFVAGQLVKCNTTGKYEILVVESSTYDEINTKTVVTVTGGVLPDPLLGVEIPSWQTVGEQTNLTDESTQNLIEVSSKDGNHQKFIDGKKGNTIELESFYVPDDTAFLALQSAHSDGGLVVLRRSEDGVSVEEAEAYIASISKNAPDGEASTVTISFTLNEAWHAISA
jgi:hypothetical protein